MTKKQIRRMLMTEGSLYFLVSLLIADTVGLVLMKSVLMRTVGQTFFFVYTPSVTASLAAMPLLLLIAFGVPLYNYRKMCRETIVERIREEGERKAVRREYDGVSVQLETVKAKFLSDR